MAECSENTLYLSTCCYLIAWLYTVRFLVPCQSGTLSGWLNCSKTSVEPWLWQRWVLQLACGYFSSFKILLKMSRIHAVTTSPFVVTSYYTIVHPPKHQETNCVQFRPGLSILCGIFETSKRLFCFLICISIHLTNAWWKIPFIMEYLKWEYVTVYRLPHQTPDTRH